METSSHYSFKNEKRLIGLVIIGLFTLLLLSCNYGGNQKKSDSGNPPSASLITKTSIDGVEIIGKTLREIKTSLNPSFELEEDCFEESNTLVVRSGETFLYTLFAGIGDGIVSFARIGDAALATADGLRVGCTSGDILKKYPQAMVHGWSDDDGGWWEYTEINGITFHFDSDFENSVGDYSKNKFSKIVNKNIKVGWIELGRNN